MAKAARKVTVATTAPVAPASAPVTKAASYVAPALVSAAAPAQAATQAAIAFLQQSLGVAPAAPVAPQQPTVTRAAGVSTRTAFTWGRSVPQGRAVLMPKVSANFAPAQVITVLSAANPKAAGKAPASRFALYGGYQGHTLTVAAYLAACAKRNIPPAVTHADLMWDFNHGYINVA